MTTDMIPDAFIWTKIQAEAGQPINRILYRKELERQTGGTFWWGIGESKAEKIGLLVGRKSCVPVLFSKMLSSPNPRDSNPDGVLLWEGYKTSAGSLPLPLHAIVTSRAHDSKGRPKSRHYALVCTSDLSIIRSGGGSLDTGILSNIGIGGKSVGSSQITAVVERTARNCNGRSYPITARAMLMAPYAVQLVAQKTLSEREIRLLDEASVGTMNANDWIAVTKQLRRTW